MRRAFLTAYVDIGSIRETCRRLGINHRRIYEWRDRYPDFAESLKDCELAAIDKVETALFKQALRSRGTADRIFFLKKRKPEVYGDHVGRYSPEHLEALMKSRGSTTVNVSASATSTTIAVETLTDDELHTLRTLLEKLGVPAPTRAPALPDAAEASVTTP